ncbi:MAG: glucosamine-6-phosphate deaminase [Treponema sp.]|nr:glucosamine-6-phosphate deaminase [Treponema sp.]
MELSIHRDYQGICRWTADYLIERIKAFGPTRERPFVLGLPTGSTPLGVYRALVSAYNEGKISFAHVLTFNMDEYLGLPGDHPQSYRYFMEESLFRHVDISPGNTHVPNGMAVEPLKECAAYEEAIKNAGGMELILGGVGANGHIAFNEPGSSFGSRTRVEVLANETIMSNAKFFDGELSEVPTRAITMGIGTVMEAREIIILASGQQKARAIQEAVEGPLNHHCPLSVLQMHQNATIVCDEEAAQELRYRTVLQNKTWD